MSKRRPRFTLTPDAKGDLLEVAAYIKRDSPGAASRVVCELREAIHQLAASPGIGHRREDLTSEPFRFWLVYSYLIIYRDASKPLEVLRVLHAARDVAAILRRIK